MTTTHENLTPNVVMITVNYHSEPQITQLIGSLGGDLASIDSAFVIVSNSGPVEGISEDERRKIILAPGNVGFGRACNLGARLFESRYLLFVNPDVLLDPGVVKTMVDLADSHPDFGVVTVFTWESSDRDFRPTGKLLDISDQNFGACFLISSQLFRELNGFDEEIFLWFEDTDLRDRVLAAGKKVGFVDGVVVPHSGGHSTGGPDLATQRFLTRAWLMSHAHYRIKHKGWLNAVVWCSGMTAVNLFRSLTGRRMALRPYFQPAEAVKQGLWMLANCYRLPEKVKFKYDGK